MSSMPRFKKSAIAVVVAAAAIGGLTALPAHADARSSIVAAVQSQLGHGPGSGYSNGYGQTSSANGQPWCADFAGWAWAQGGGVQHLSSLSDGAASFYDYGVEYGTLSNTPHPGDAVVFSYDSDSDWAKHVEIVTAVSGSQITAIGGNENNEVEKDTFSNGAVGTSTYNGTISGYISPVMAAGTTAAPKAIRGDKGSVVGTDGTSMTFTRTAANGHLQLSYLPKGGSWSTTDLTSTVGTPVSAGGDPAAFVQQNGTLGAITANSANGHLQMTYKASTDGSWHTTDLTALVGTPVTGGDYSVITDADGTLAIYSRNSANGHLQLTYLPKGGSWSTTDLTASVGTPATVDGGAPAAFAMRNGTIGAITSNSSNGHLQLTYKAPSGWSTTDLTSYVGTPATDGAVSAITDADGTLAIYSRDSANNHLQLTYIAATTGQWSTTDLTNVAGTPTSAGTAPALFTQPDGTLGIVTANTANGHLQLTYRPTSGKWTSTDLTTLAGAAPTDGKHISSAYNPDGTLVIYSRNSANGHLQMTYNPASAPWANSDLTNYIGTPAE